MKKYFFILLITFSLLNSQENTKNDTTSVPSLKYGLYSAVLPGLGQFQIYRETSKKQLLNRSLYYFSFESIALLSSILFNNKYEKKKDEYKLYADSNWDFGRWIYNYEHFQSTDLSYLWEEIISYGDGSQEAIWKGIGEGSHFIRFSMGNQSNIISTTDDLFIPVRDDIIEFYESGCSHSDGSQHDNIYTHLDIEIRKDQHFYENIGKYNEYFSGWLDADTINTTVVVTDLGYPTPRSPIKTTYSNLYNDAENLSDISEISRLCIYFNHFISMLDAFVLARKYHGHVMLSSSTVYDYKNKNKSPIGVNIKLTFRL